MCDRKYEQNIVLLGKFQKHIKSLALSDRYRVLPIGYLAILLAEITFELYSAVSFPCHLSGKFRGHDEVLRIDLFTVIHLVEISDLVVKESLYTGFWKKQSLTHPEQFLDGK